MTLLDISVLVLGVAAYHILLHLLHLCLKRAFPAFYLPLLHRLGTRQTKALLVFPIGVLLSLVTAPVCAHALLADPFPPSQFGSATAKPALDSRICSDVRAVMWTAELPLLGAAHHQYLVHHVLALAALFTFKTTALHMQPVHLTCAGLITEVLSSTRAFVRGTHLHLRHPLFTRRLTLATAVSVLLLRLPSTFLLHLQLLFGARRVHLTTRLGLAIYLGQLLYITYITYTAVRLLASLGIVSIIRKRPAHIIFRTGGSTGKAGRCVTVYSLLLGLAIAAAQITAAVMYELPSHEPLRQAEIRSLAMIGLGAAVSGLFGAKLMNSILCLPATVQAQTTPHAVGENLGAGDEKSAVSVMAECPSTDRLFPWFRGISIQGAIFFSTLWITLGPGLLGLPVRKRDLVGAVGMSLPLGEAIGRLGCYLSGCCGSTATRKKRYFPNLQLLAALLNGTIFFERCVHVAHNREVVGIICEAGAVAVIENAVVRLVLNPLRDDTAEKMVTPTSVFSAAQLLFFAALFMLQRSVTAATETTTTMGGGGLTSSLTAVAEVFCNSVVVCRLAICAWEQAARLVVQGRRRSLRRFVRARHMVYVLSFFILLLVLGSSGEREEEMQRMKSLPSVQPGGSLVLVSSPAFWVSVAFGAVLPVILLN